MPELLARLDGKTGLRVLCAWPTCRGELARVAILEGDKRVLCMLDGWKQTERGHFTLNQHSAKRATTATAAVRRGELARDLLEAHKRPRYRQPIPDGHDANLAAYGLASDNFVIYPGPSGILADCPIPSCGRVNLLLASHLRVATE